MLKVKNCVKSDLEILSVFFLSFDLFGRSILLFVLTTVRPNYTIVQRTGKSTQPPHATLFRSTDYKNNKNYSEKVTEML